MTLILMLLMRKPRQGDLREQLTISQLVEELTKGPLALESVFCDFYYDRKKHFSSFHLKSALRLSPLF